MEDTISAVLEAVGHQRSGDVAQAEAIYQRVLSREPDQPNALYLYGLLKLRDGRAAGAVDLLGRAAMLRPDHEVGLHLARAQTAAGHHESALATVDEAMASGCDCAEALYLRGTALNALGRPSQAIVALSRAARLDPGHAGIRLNLGNAYADLDQLDTAEESVRKALTLDPALIEAHASLGFILCSLGRYQKAIDACEAGLAIDPDSPELHWNLATALLLSGNFARGFFEYEWHKQHRQFRSYIRVLPGTCWTGFALAGRTLLVDADQGLGDTIQLARYAPLLVTLGARVILCCSQHLVPLLSGQPGFAAVVSRAAPLPPYDCWVNQMSLPRYLGTLPDSIPAAAGYLTADSHRRSHWIKRLPGAQIGLAWAGNPRHSNDLRRSLPLPIVRAIVRPGMISLQTGMRASEADALGLDDLSPGLTDFAETAALIANLDLVITVDTAVAHLAGALGIPTWVMLPFAPDWRWLAGRDDSPWYQSIRLFRQPSPGDWTSVVRRINNLLDTWP